MADEPDGTVRQLAVRRRRLRALLRLHRRRDEPVRARDLRRDDSGRARSDAGGGLPLHGGHDRSRDRLGPPAEGVDARQAVLRLLRARRHARAPPRSAGVVGQVQGPLRRRLGRAARGDARTPEGARRGPRGRRAHRAARGDPGVGGHARRPQARARPPDGGLCRLHGAHRPPRRPADGCTRRARDPRRHAGLRDGRRQRRLGRGHAQWLLQRARRAQRRRRRRDGRVHGLAHRRLRHAQGLQPLRRRLGPRDGHALPVDQADRLALGRHPQRHDRPLAGRHQGQGRDPHAVPPRHRHRRHGARRGRAPGAHVRPWGAADAAAWRVHGVLVRRRDSRRAARDPVLRDVLQPRHLPQGLDRGHPPQHAVGDGAEPPARRRRLGALRPRRLDAGPRPRRRAARQAGRAAAAVPHRGDEVQRPAPRRPPRRALQPGPGRAPGAHPGHPPTAVRRHGPAVGELRRRPQEQVARRDGADRRPRWRRRGGDRRSGRRLRGLEPVPQGRPAGLLLQPLRPAAFQGARRDPRLLRRASGADGVRLRRRRPGEGRNRDVVRGRGPGRRRPHRRHCADGSSRPTRPPTSGRTAGRP